MKTLSTSDLRNGDQIFQKNNWNVRDVNTYMSPMVYFGINFWPKINGTEITPANHCGTLYFIDGEWYVFEAKLKFTKTRLVDKIANKDITALYIKRYPINSYQALMMREFAEKMIGLPYDGWSIVKQVFRKLFNNNLDLETNPRIYKNKAVNCSEGNSMQLEVIRITFWNTKSVGPDDLWLDNRSTLIGRIK